MFILKKIGCRAVQLVFRAVLPVLPYREPKILPCVDALGEVFLKEGTSSVLIVTSAGSAKRGLIAPTEEILKKQGIRYAIYNKTQPNPTVANVEEALEMYHKNGCDTLVAIGGGSVLDCAKGVGARVAYPQKGLNKLAGVMKVLRRIPLLIAIPTTAGTGSEATLAAVITDGQTHHKYAIMSFPLIPRYAVLDATLTYSMPPHLTATTGMDALTHAVEAYIGRATTRRTRKLALEATALVFQNVEKAYHNGQDARARENMLHAAYKAGVAFSVSYVGYIHAIAHSLGGKYDTPHGLANAVIMPHVLAGYGKSAHKKLHRLGIAADACTVGDSHEVGAKKFIEAVRALNESMHIPPVISGIEEADIPTLAKHAEREANPLYPVPRLMTGKELEVFYYNILDLDTKKR
ncbi:MAG: iron-containing alcohol dehydrogenase [Clostridia bacterium]|nr:iron-containing alcohol dehydrogenase [Clostridia bacterium]